MVDGEVILIGITIAYTASIPLTDGKNSLVLLLIMHGPTIKSNCGMIACRFMNFMIICWRNNTCMSLHPCGKCPEAVGV